MSTMHGSTADGTPITDEMVEAMADESERGYDVEEVLRRSRGGRPLMGSAASSVESAPERRRSERDIPSPGTSDRASGRPPTGEGSAQSTNTRVTTSASPSGRLDRDSSGGRGT